MASDTSASGISPAQASLLIALMREQSETAVASLLTSDPTNGDGTSTLSDSFSSLLATSLATGGGWQDSRQLTTLTSSTTSTRGTQIADIATQLAGDLRGVNNRSFDPAVTPLAAQQTWNSGSWGNGNVQCVAFVAGVYHQAGTSLPVAPNATQFWGAYAHRSGWTEVANGAGMPQPGDIIAMSGGGQGYGHVAIVTAVTPPANGKPGSITIAQSNSPKAQTTMTINADGSVASWPGYQVQGFIRQAN